MYLETCQLKVIHTCLVKLHEVAWSVGALVLILPWTAQETVLMKLDFPAPVGPCSRILSCFTSLNSQVLRKLRISSILFYVFKAKKKVKKKSKTQNQSQVSTADMGWNETSWVGSEVKREK